MRQPRPLEMNGQPFCCQKSLKRTPMPVPDVTPRIAYSLIKRISDAEVAEHNKLIVNRTGKQLE